MDRTRKLAMVGATFLVAAATGQFMQNGALNRPVAAAPKAPVVLARAETPVDITPLAATTAAVALPDMPPAASLPAVPVSLRELPKDQAIVVMPGTGPARSASCDPKVDMSVGAAAMLELKVLAPCNPGQRVVIRHEGLALTGLTGPDGALSVAIPALARTARVNIRLDGGQTVTAAADVPELALFDRVAIQWMGNDSFQLHALEFGADFGTPGDVSAVDPRTPASATLGRGGFLTILGNEKVDLPMLAEVYTFPSGIDTPKGNVKLVVEAAVTEGTCGRDMLAQTLRTQADGSVKTDDLTLAMPDCNSVGQFVELNNVLPDIRVAAK